MIALLFSFALATAQTADEFGVIFKWTSSGSLNLSIRPAGGQLNRFPPMSLKDAAGEVAEGDSNGVHAIVTSYGPFLTLVFGKAGGDAQLVILEKMNASVDVISNPIAGRLAEIPGQVKYAIKRYAELKKSDTADASGCFRQMVAYFDASPNKQLSDFADVLERGLEPAVVIAKPPTRVADQPAGSAPAPAPRPAAPPAPPRRVVQQQPQNPYYEQAPPQRQARRAPPPGYYQQQQRPSPQQQGDWLQQMFGL